MIRRVLVALCALMCVSLSGITSAQASTWDVVSTVAGGNGYGSNDNQLSVTIAVTADSDGNLFVSDTSNHRVQKVTSEGVVSTVAGDNGVGPDSNRLNNPRGIVLDTSGNFYVADSSNNRVQKVTPQGVFSTVAGGNGRGSAANQLNDPAALAIDSDGNIYIADPYNHRVQKVTPQGLVSTVAGGNGGGSAANQLMFPNGVAVDSSGNLYVADSSNHRVRKVTSQGVVSTVAGGNGGGPAANQLMDPGGVTVDLSGNIYVADSGNNRVQKLTPEGVVSTVAGADGLGSGVNQLNQPTGLMVDAEGALLIADAVNYRVQRVVFDLAGPALTIGTDGELRAGSGARASFGCSDAVSGVASCQATLNGLSITDGALLPAVAGTYTLSVTSVDQAANSTSDSITFSVVAKRELSGAFSGLDGSDASIARLYMATYRRNPDAQGFSYWKSRHAAGFTLTEMSAFFVSSSEFEAAYGDTSDEEFVRLMYRNVLAREAEPSGFSYWVGRLGTDLSRAKMLLFFSDAPEFRALTKTG